jgi:glycosyltransferase involved in cell wall biosynthesis
MTRITLVMAYYENAAMLAEQFARIRALPADLRDRIEVVIVDDGSPDHPARAEEIGCRLQMFRLTVDVRWNQDACRNIGVHHTETEWVLLTDMDHVVPEPRSSPTPRPHAMPARPTRIAPAWRQ